METQTPTKLPSSGFRVSLEELVDDSVEVHKTSILPQVIFRLPEKHIDLTVATTDGYFPWFG